jgi:hypothetical protein
MVPDFPGIKAINPGEIARRRGKSKRKNQCYDMRLVQIRNTGRIIGINSRGIYMKHQLDLLARTVLSAPHTH